LHDDLSLHVCLDLSTRQRAKLEMKLPRSRQLPLDLPACCCSPASVAVAQLARAPIARLIRWMIKGITLTLLSGWTPTYVVLLPGYNLQLALNKSQGEIPGAMARHWLLDELEYQRVGASCHGGWEQLHRALQTNTQTHPPPECPVRDQHQQMAEERELGKAASNNPIHRRRQHPSLALVKCFLIMAEYPVCQAETAQFLSRRTKPAPVLVISASWCRLSVLALPRLS